MAWTWRAFVQDIARTYDRKTLGLVKVSMLGKGAGGENSDWNPPHLKFVYHFVQPLITL